MGSCTSPVGTAARGCSAAPGHPSELARPSTWWHCSSCPAGVVLTPRVHKAAPRAGLEIQTDLQLKFQGVQLGGERIWILSPSEGAMALKKVQCTTFMSNQLIPLEHGVWH